MDLAASAVNSASPNTDETLLRGLAGLVQSDLARDEVLKHAVAMLKGSRPHFTWFGIYILDGDTLVLGPYIGRPTEHVRIPIGAGICGLAARTKETVNVADVNADPRYLACSLETKSELVVPIMRNGAVLGEIDVDSDAPSAFTADDEELLGAAADLLATALVR